MYYMSMKDLMKKVFVKLGENNKPTYAVMAIAVVKGIARPLFTMSDKHADPETKKYTAIREGLTEVVAIPTYYACGELAGNVASKLKFDHIPNPELQKYARKNAQQNFMFLGVCLAALLVIPALASVTIKPFMKKIQEKNKATNNAVDNAQKLDIDDLFEIDDDEIKKQVMPSFQAHKPVHTPYYNTAYTSSGISGMKVGGV